MAEINEKYKVSEKYASAKTKVMSWFKKSE